MSSNPETTSEYILPLTYPGRDSENVASFDVGTPEFPCIGQNEIAKNVGQLAQQISDFSDDWTHEELCAHILVFVDTANGK